MQVQKFKRIVEYNRVHREEAEACVDKAYGLLNLKGDLIMDVAQVVRPLLMEKGFFLFQIPMKDNEIGALCYRGGECGYVLINSALPKATVNFALLHEFCHVCVNEDVEKERIELFTNEDYLEDDRERRANQFAGMVLMPERLFRNMYSRFMAEKNDSDYRVIVCKLMYYFGAPYTAAMIRLSELGLLGDVSGKEIHSLLEITEEEKVDIYNKNWMDLAALKASNQDDFDRIIRMLSYYGKKLVTDEYMSERVEERAIRNIQKLYHCIRREEND